jgi:hypothetical protein
MEIIRPSVSLSILGQCAIHGAIQEKWKPFPNILEEFGVEVVCIENVGSLHHFEIDHQIKAKDLGSDLIPVNRTLVRLEPKCVNPTQYRKSIEKLYENIIVVSPLQKSQANQIVWESGYLPNSTDLLKKLNWCRSIVKKPGICFVNQNKFSFIKGELYTLRRRAINEFLAKGFAFDLAGGDWDRSKMWDLKSRLSCFKNTLINYRFMTLKGFLTWIDIKNPNLNYHGKVLDSVEFMANFRFALIIENEASYVSEKLLNAIIAGCVPIYCGPNLSEFGLPEGMAIETGLNIDMMVRRFQSISHSELEMILSVGLDWAKSIQAQERWGVENSYYRLAKLMTEIIDT